MKKEKIKYLFDFIPLLILAASAIILVSSIISNDAGFLWKHIVGLILVPVLCLLFWWHHQIGVLASGITILIGLVGLLSYSYAISITTTYIGNIPIFYGQPIFLLWLLIHWIVSGRYYVGIVTKNIGKAFLINQT